MTLILADSEGIKEQQTPFRGFLKLKKVPRRERERKALQCAFLEGNGERAMEMEGAEVNSKRSVGAMNGSSWVLVSEMRRRCWLLVGLCGDAECKISFSFSLNFCFGQF